MKILTEKGFSQGLGLIRVWDTESFGMNVIREYRDFRKAIDLAFSQVSFQFLHNVKCQGAWLLLCSQFLNPRDGEWMTVRYSCTLRRYKRSVLSEKETFINRISWFWCFTIATEVKQYLLYISTSQKACHLWHLANYLTHKNTLLLWSLCPLQGHSTALN